MIQRIQSLYLLLAIVLPVFTYIVPLGQFSQGETEFALYSCHYDAEQVAALAGRMPYGLLILSLASIALAVVALLGFKNRVAQLKKVAWTMAVQVLWFVACGAYSASLASRLDMDFTPGLGLVFPLLSLACLVMARRGIRHDEALVRAADRIR